MKRDCSYDEWCTQTRPGNRKNLLIHRSKVKDYNLEYNSVVNSWEDHKRYIAIPEPYEYIWFGDWGIRYPYHILQEIEFQYHCGFVERYIRRPTRNFFERLEDLLDELEEENK